MKSPGTIDIGQKLHASSSYETTTTAVPIHIDDTVFKGKLPLFIRSLCTQFPATGAFTVEDLDWKLVGTGTQMGLAAAFPQNRLHDFRAGESERGRCRVDISNVMPPTEGVPMSVRGVCVFAAPHSAVEKRRQAEPASAPPLPCKEGVKARYGKHQIGTSCKKNCAYYFFAKAYAKCPGVVIIKFPCCEGDTPATCASMKHCTPAGHPAHTDDDAQIFLRQWSERATDLIIDQLKQQKKPSHIVQEVKSCILKWLNIPEGTPAHEIQQTVAASPFAKDFNVTPARIRYLRQQYVDVKWMDPQPAPAPRRAAAAASAATASPASAAAQWTDPHAADARFKAPASVKTNAPGVTSSSAPALQRPSILDAPAITAVPASFAASAVALAAVPAAVAVAAAPAVLGAPPTAAPVPDAPAASAAPPMTASMASIAASAIPAGAAPAISAGQGRPAVAVAAASPVAPATAATPAPANPAVPPALAAAEAAGDLGSSAASAIASPAGPSISAVPAAPAAPDALASIAAPAVASISPVTTTLAITTAPDVAAASAITSTTSIAAVIDAAQGVGSRPQGDETPGSALPGAPAENSVSSQIVAQAQEEVEMLVKLAFWQIHKSPAHVQQAQMHQVRSAVMSTCWEVLSLQKQANDETVQESVKEASTPCVARSTDAVEAISKSHSTPRTRKQAAPDSDAPAQSAPAWRQSQEDCALKSHCDDSGPHPTLHHESDQVLTGCQAQQAAQVLERCITQLSTQEPERRALDVGLAPDRKRVKLDPVLEQDALPAQRPQVEQPVQQPESLQSMLGTLLQQHSQAQEDRVLAQFREQQQLQQSCLDLLQQLAQQHMMKQQQKPAEALNQHDVLHLISLGLHGAGSNS